MEPPGRLSGRRAQAARNDELILEAAREVFVADPEAPISAVARRAGVGIAALYRRYPSKEDLLRRLVREGLHQYLQAAEEAVADGGDPWNVFATFLHRVVDADTHSMTLRLAGTFAPTEDLPREADRAQHLNVRLFERTQAAGALRPDLVVDDLSFVLQQVASVRLADQGRTSELRHRYLALHLDALRARPGTPLPGPPPSWEEVSGRWSG